jgi:hypothetical protein
LRQPRRLALLERIGIVELRPLNRYRLKLAKTFRWRPHGPVMNFFREEVLLDYYVGGFAQQHLADQKLPEAEREGYTPLLATRSWEFAGFTALRR